MKFTLKYIDNFCVGIRSNTNANLLLYVPKIYLERGQVEICTNQGITLYLARNRAIQVTRLKFHYPGTEHHNIKSFKSRFGITVRPSYLQAVKENIKL